MIDDEIKQAIENAHAFGIVSHIRPDGDAIGAVLAMGLALIAKEKSVEIVLRSGISKTFRHLPGAELVRRSFHGDYDLSIVLDCSDEERTGECSKGKYRMSSSTIILPIPNFVKST
jgi:phosphoesterase RecJ-like protein